MSLRDRILSADDISRERVEVPQWGVTVEVRTMSAGQRSRMIQSCSLPDGSINLDKLYPMLIVATVFDPETGIQVFSESDMALLQEKSAASVEFVAQKAMSMSGMTANAIDDEGKDS